MLREDLEVVAEPCIRILLSLPEFLFLKTDASPQGGSESARFKKPTSGPCQ